MQIQNSESVIFLAFGRSFSDNMNITESDLLNHALDCSLDKLKVCHFCPFGIRSRLLLSISR